MDLGIKGKWALVCGASKGLGFGCAQALAREGAHVVIVARGAEALEAAAGRLRAAAAGTAAPFVKAVAADITTPEGRAAACSASAPRATITTCAPSRASACAQPKPRPLLAPHTSAHLPLMPKSIDMSAVRESICG